MVRSHLTFNLKKK